MYKIKLTNAEAETLAWLTDRGYWPREAYDAMRLEDGQDEDSEDELTWCIDEPAAWSIREASEDEGFLTCCGEPLAGKLVDLWQSIV